MFPSATGFSPVSKKFGKPTKLQRRRLAWVGQADFEKNRGKQRKPLPELSCLIDLTCRS